MKTSTPQLSRHRRHLRQLLVQIEKLTFRCAYPAPLIKGTPSEVFRTCGKAGCKCARDPADRHGPYRVIQIKRDGKAKQVPLKKSDNAHWEQAKLYQKQIKTLAQLKACLMELENGVRLIIKARCQEWPT